MSIVTKTILIHNDLSLGKYKAHNLFKNSPTCKNKNKYKQTKKPSLQSYLALSMFQKESWQNRFTTMFP